MTCLHASPDHSCSNSPQGCAPSAGGCLRCDTIPGDKIPTNTDTILFGHMDADAGAALTAALAAGNFSIESHGPVLIVRGIRERFSELGLLISSQLSLYTQSCIKAAYSPLNLQTVTQALSAMIYAEPLTDMLAHIEHEWIRTALNENWLFSVFHPIIDARSGEIFANEALLRARNPRETSVYGAGTIINACEKLNLLHQLDQRARQSAIKAASEHVPTSSRIFINFLPNTIYDPEICLRTTMEAAAKHHVAMNRLVFEVVETEQIPDMENLIRILDYYRDRGVGTAIDDMGAGYTGLDYITSLRPDFVKLDREFVLTAEATSEGRRAMDAMIAASHLNKARVVAEGIETVAQMRMCVDSGVDLLQGFLFAKPACPPNRVILPDSYRAAA